MDPTKNKEILSQQWSGVDRSQVCVPSLGTQLLSSIQLANKAWEINNYSGAPRAKRASGAPWVNKCTHPRKFGNHVTDRPSAPQAYQCLLSHFLATLGAQEKADCTSMLSSIDSCQNRVSADQYHLTVSRAQVSNHQGRVYFLKLSADNSLVFKWSQAQFF